MNAITVTQLSNYIKALLEADVHLMNVCVRGELSNYKMHPTGHHYFSLKDDGAVISCVMFRGNAQKLRFVPQNGMKVILTGKISSFPKSGVYQIYVGDMQPEGIGALYAAFEQLKQKLYAEGLFDKSLKKPIPKYPGKIALVTAKSGAAVRDMIRILKARYPLASVLVCSVKVQGEGAAEEIADMLDYINKYRLSDVIICGRGGGSVEDLWAFNEEVLARAIARSEIPVISAVGHEPDVTISDYVADLRAATPSNAAELAVCDSVELKANLSAAFSRMIHSEKVLIESRKRELLRLSSKRQLSSPDQLFNDKKILLALYEQKAEKAIGKIVSDARQRFTKAAATLDAISPLKVLARGYSVASANGKVIKSVKEVHENDLINVRMSDGVLDCTVNKKENV